MNGLLGFGDKLYQAFLVEDRWRLYLDGNFKSEATAVLQ